MQTNIGASLHGYVKSDSLENIVQSIPLDSARDSQKGGIFIKHSSLIHQKETRKSCMKPNVS